AGALPYLAHTQREFAAMLLDREQRGDRDRAERLLAECVETYRRLGMEPWLRSAEALAQGSIVPNEFRRDGDVWTVAFAGRGIRLKDSKGLRDIAILLQRPGTEVHC